MRAAPLILPLLFAAGCAGPALVDGEIGSTPFTKARSAWFGGPFIVIATEAIDCNQMGWVQRRYTEGAPADRREFAALQITFSGEAIEVGSFLADRTQGVTVDGLENDGSDLRIHHAREGTIDIEDVSASRVSGTFSVAFGEGGVAGEFDAEPCVNLRP